MALRTEHIPPNILAAANRAGLKRPDWYVGPRANPKHVQRCTLADIVAEVDSRAYRRAVPGEENG